MTKKIIPAELIGHTELDVYSRFSVRSHVIYLILLAAIITVLVLLPILKVSVSVQSQGIIRPAIEKNEIKALVSGVIKSIQVTEHDTVDSGSVLIELSAEPIEQKINFLQAEIDKKKQRIHDLELFLSEKNVLKLDASKLKTELFKSEFSLLKQQIKENSTQQYKAHKDLKRLQQLYEQDTVSAQEVEEKKYTLSQLRVKKDSVLAQRISGWQDELTLKKSTMLEQTTQLQQLANDRELYRIKSPIAGDLEQFSGMSEGSYVQAGQLIAVVSPNNELMIEAYVSPIDIGLVQAGTKVNVHIDSFNYNQWGFIQGEVVEIAEDFILVNNQPSFRIRCRLSQNYLQLKSGYKGHLKKGMTANVRFIIQERTLFQLLYDEVDDWINPING